MNKKVGLTEASIIVSLAIILVLVSAYVPALGILGLFISIPYAIIGTLGNKKYSVLSIIATFFILMITTNPVYAVNICLMSAVPGMIMGHIVKKCIEQDETNKFVPIYGGIIAFTTSILIFLLVSKVILGTDLVADFIKILKESILSQFETMKEMNPEMLKGITTDDIVNLIRGMIPAMLLLQGTFLSFITYYTEVFILRRLRSINIKAPKLKEFYLPGNAVAASFMLYLLIIGIGYMDIDFNTNLVMLNLQLVFNTLFMVQGIAVCIFFAVVWMKNKPKGMLFFWAIILAMTGTMGVSFIGMLDSVVDFRRVRIYKSI